MSLKIQIQYFLEFSNTFSPSYMIVSGTKNKKFIFICILWKKMVESCVFHSVPKYKKNSEELNMPYYHFVIATSYHFIYFWSLEEPNYLKYTTAFQVNLLFSFKNKYCNPHRWCNMSNQKNWLCFLREKFITVNWWDFKFSSFKQSLTRWWLSKS